jgi:hypothetical protein
VNLPAGSGPVLCAIDVKIPTREEVLENPRRAWLIAGGWVNDSEPDSIYIYWHRRQNHFTVYSLLQILEHEILHAVLLSLVSAKISMGLDKVHRSACVKLDESNFVFANEFWMGDWEFPPYLEEPIEDLLR